MMRKQPNRQQARDRSEIEDSTTAGKGDFMEAMIAACAAIAFADGTLDIRERRKIFTLMQTNPSFAGFSHAEVSIEFARHNTAFEEDPVSARREALITIKALKASPTEAKLILDACRQVLQADEVTHPHELSAFAEINAVLLPS